MGLPKQPDVVVRIPSSIFIGQRIVGEIEIHVEREVKLDFIDVRITGVQHWVLAGSHHGGHVFPNLVKRIMETRTLAVGTHRFPIAFTLPPGTAPSHEISPAYARTYLEVHAAIPWWPDGNYRFTLNARLAGPHGAVRTPVVAREPFEAGPSAPRIEVALASTTLVAGEVLQGSYAAIHTEDLKAHAITFSFVPYLVMHSDSRPHSHWSAGYSTTVRVPEGAAGKSFPLRVQLPENMTPSFRTVNHELRWYLKARLGSFLSGHSDLMIPLVILDASASTQLPRLELVPRVADERVTAIFERFATQRQIELVVGETDEFPGEQPALAQRIGDDEIRIGHAYRGKDGTLLIGRVRYPSLGLGLSVSPSTPTRELLSSDVEIDIREWDRVHHVDAREATQTAPFLRSVIETIRIHPSIMSWTDEMLRIELPVANIEHDALEVIHSHLTQIARVINDARQTIALPGGVAIDVDAWRGLAARVGGRLCVGDVSIAGKLDTTPVVIALQFDDVGQPTAMRVFVGDRETSSERAREATLSLARPAAGYADVTPERLRDIFSRWSDDVVSLELSNGVAAASLPVPGSGTDAVRVRELIRALQGVLAALDESAGPYR